jgi:serine/threonine-protein kinase
MRDPIVGERLDRYELGELLARSGMASIFRAVDLETGAPVALKIPHVQFESDVVFSERFRREVEIGQRLQHPNVVRVLEAPPDASRVYMVMELLDGRSLRALLGKGPLPADRALDIARQLASALHYLHSEGVVHRDLKPENVLLTPDGTAKIIDFGIALFAGERRLTWQGLSNAIGTPDYMAPEQIRGKRGDPRSDVYAVGTILYEMLTGHLPFEGATPRAILKEKTGEDPHPPSYHVPGFDPRLEAILLRALERDPRDRYATAALLEHDLAHPEQVVPRDPETGAARRRTRALSRRLAIAAMAAAALTVLCGLVWLTQHSAAPRPDAPAPAARGR